ncbi:Dyp-type peroxidase [Solirubrobacter soli]|uniref:Dyp-type peroxidase n=1 Tax=Solirubrobacter soli TaxID=363832 RepID=UPI00041405BB|nr:Dyp-type peroxidase [Solirubrobacter soli]
MAAADLNRDDMQGLLASGYGHLPAARFVLLSVTDAGAAGPWLERLAGELTTARGRTAGPTVNVALTAPGLLALGLPREALDGFSAQFREGIVSEHRSRALGDIGDGAPEYWAWGGPNGPAVHLALLLYAGDGTELDAIQRDLVGDASSGVSVTAELDTTPGDRDHFGFADGISQPVIEGMRDGRPDDVVKAGEFVLGYPNQYGQLTGRPLLPARDDRDRILPPDPEGSGGADLGANGSYLVFRQLEQDVPAFWSFVEGAADGDAIELASRMVGRWPDGAPLVLAPDHPPPELGDLNAFRYHRLDPDGLRCPLGAHVRRAHPRDMLDPHPGTEHSIGIDKHHRLLRRGRRYGTEMSRDAAINGGAEGSRGLHFLCLCGNIQRQFEFIQHTWVNSPKFAGLRDDADPLLGPPGRTMTIQAEPVRKRVMDLPSFVKTVGGGYFFLPGVRATRYLGRLSERSAS